MQSPSLILIRGFTGIANASMYDINMPPVRKACVITPKGPFNSIGTVSLINRGPYTEKLPAPSPYMNLPTRIAY